MVSTIWFRKGLVLCGLMGVVGTAQVSMAAGNPDRAAILKLVPADVAVALVATNLEKTDKSLAAMVKGIDPDAEAVNLLAGIKSELEIGDWVDFSKPFAMIQPDANSGDAGLFFAYVSDFDVKIKKLNGAVEKEGVWEITKGGAAGEAVKPSLFLMRKGAVVAGSSVRKFLDLVGKGPDLGGVLSAQPRDIAGRDFLIHVNMSPLREKVVGAISMYGPMMAMMAGAQGGGDPVATTAVINAVVDGVLGFAKQLATLDLAADFSADGVGVTLATRFTDGAIKQYLGKQKPAELPLLTTVAEQPYTMAFGYHMPGEGSAFISYLLDKTIAAMPKKPAAGDDAQQGADDGAKDKALESVKDFYAKIEGFNAVIQFSDKGLYEAGDVVGADAQELLKLSKVSLERAGDLMSSFGMGMSGYKSLGTKPLGKTQADVYQLEIDPNNPTASQATAMMGKDMRLALGVDADRLRFGFGKEADLQRAFAPVGGKSMAASKYAKAALGALPKRRNLVVLIDPAGILSMIAAVAPMPVASIGPNEPFAISVSLAGEPARVDIHVPARSIRAIVKAFEPEEPM